MDKITNLKETKLVGQKLADIRQKINTWGQLFKASLA